MSSKIICDVDGCLVPPRGEMWDFPSLQKVAENNVAGEVTLTLCSGRPATFMEALARQLMITSYCICENGSILFHPMTKVGVIHPDVPKEFMQERLGILKRLQELVAGTDIIIELGKDVMISVNSPDKSALGELYEQVRGELVGAPVEIMNSGRSIEVVPKGVTKAAGLAFWAELEKVPMDRTISVGDADNDLTILKAAAFAAAPANCTPRVREVVDYVSPKPMVLGVLDIMEQVRTGSFGQR